MQPLGEDVANVLGPVTAGDELRILPEATPLTATADIPRNHKVALLDFAPGEVVTRNGIAIGSPAPSPPVVMCTSKTCARCARGRPARRIFRRDRADAHAHQGHAFRRKLRQGQMVSGA